MLFLLSLKLCRTLHFLGFVCHSIMISVERYRGMVKFIVTLVLLVFYCLVFTSF